LATLGAGGAQASGCERPGEGAGSAAAGVRHFHKFIMLFWSAKCKRLCVYIAAARRRSCERTAKAELQRL